MKKLSIPKLQRLYCASLGMEWKSRFILHFTGAFDYLSMLGSKLIHASKMGPRYATHVYVGVDQKDW